MTTQNGSQPPTDLPSGSPSEQPASSTKTKDLLAWRVLPYVISVIAAFLVGAGLILILGHDPVRALEPVLTTSFATKFGIVETLHKWVPVVLCALAFTIPLATGKFNIGAEGQLLVGATAGVAIGILWSDLPMVLLLPSVLLAGILAGALWAGIAAFLMVRFGVNEILSTVLLNFVSFELINYVASDVWPDRGAGHPATISVGEGALMPRFGSPPSLHAGVLIAFILCVLVAVLVRSTSMGFEMKAVGANLRASRVHGIHTSRLAGAGLLIGGAIAGLAGAIEVSAVHGKMLEGMQSNFMILGIIVGLLARGNNFAVLFVGFGIAVLEVGAGSMQRTAQVPAEVVLMIEALILIFVLLSDVISARVRNSR